MNTGYSSRGFKILQGFCRFKGYINVILLQPSCQASFLPSGVCIYVTRECIIG